MTRSNRSTSEEAILETLRGAEDPALAAQELADRLGTSPRRVTERLQALEADGAVARKRSRFGDVLWWQLED